MVIAHIPDVYSLADRCLDGWTVYADGNTSEIPKRRIVSTSGRPAGGITHRRWIYGQKNQVFRPMASTAVAPGTATKQPGRVMNGITLIYPYLERGGTPQERGHRGPADD